MKRSVCLALALLVGGAAAYAQDPAADAGQPGFGRAVPCVGRVLWPGKDLTNTQLRVYVDANFRKLVEVYPTGGPRGSVVLALNPGTYYLMAFSDQDGDGRASSGDGLGFYGVTDFRDKPVAFRVDQGAGALSMNIHISAKFAGDGRQLEPIEVAALEPGAVDLETPVSGHVSGGVDESAARFVLLVPVAPGFPARAAQIKPDGTFAFTAVPGSYQLIAVENFDRDESIGAGDFIAAGDYEPFMGPSLPEMKIESGRPVKDLVLELDWVLARDGRLRSGDGSVLGPRVNVGSLPAVASGVVTRDGEPVAGATVKAYGDEKFETLHYVAKTDEAGRFWLGMTPGQYFVTVLHDKNGDGATGPGDELGFYGVTPDSPDSTPQPVTLNPGRLALSEGIPLMMVVGMDGKPAPLASTPATDG